MGADGDRQTCSLNHPYFLDFQPLLSPALCSSPTLRAELLLLIVQPRFAVLFAEAAQLSKARPSRLPFLSLHPLHPPTQLTLQRDKRLAGDLLL